MGHDHGQLTLVSSVTVVVLTAGGCHLLGLWKAGKLGLENCGRGLSSLPTPPERLPRSQRIWRDTWEVL